MALAIYGMGVSGRASLVFARTRGLTVYGWDDDPEVREKMRNEWQGQGGRWCDFLREGFPPDVDYLLLSPGIPWNGQNREHPAVQLADMARAHRLTIGCDVDFLLQHQRLPQDARLYAISGTNGKTSVVHWLSEVAAACGFPAVALGNNGAAALAQGNNFSRYFFELSSYQLDLIHQQRFERVALLNISADHLERYGAMSAYVASKAKLPTLINGSSRRCFVYSADDAYTREIGKNTPLAVPFSAQNPLEGGVYLDQGRLIDHRYRRCCVLDFGELPWLNNRQHARNLVAVYALLAGDVLPDDPRTAAPVFASAVQQAFEKLTFDHRQNPVACLTGTLFIDDSKATNTTATADALSQFQRVHWIVGGQAKAGGFEGLGQDFAQVRGVYTLGAAAEEIDAYLRQFPLLEGKIHACHTVENAIQTLASRLHHNPSAPETVLFSPACASFDQFDNYQHRGQMFQQALHRQWLAAQPFVRSSTTLSLWKAVHHGPN